MYRVSVHSECIYLVIATNAQHELTSTVFLSYYLRSCTQCYRDLLQIGETQSNQIIMIYKNEAGENQEKYFPIFKYKNLNFGKSNTRG